MHKSYSRVLFIIYFISISLLSGNKYTSQGYNFQNQIQLDRETSMCASAKDAARKSCRNWRLIAYSPPDERNGAILNSSSLLPFFIIFIRGVEAHWMAFLLDEHWGIII